MKTKKAQSAPAPISPEEIVTDILSTDNITAIKDSVTDMFLTWVEHTENPADEWKQEMCYHYRLLMDHFDKLNRAQQQASLN